MPLIYVYADGAIRNQIASFKFEHPSCGFKRPGICLKDDWPARLFVPTKENWKEKVVVKAIDRVMPEIKKDFNEASFYIVSY